MKNSKNGKFPIHQGFPVKEGMPIEVASYARAKGRQHSRIPHRQSYYGIVFFKNGEGEHIIDFESYPIKPNALFFFSPGQIHCLKITKPYSFKVIRFSENFILLSSMEQKEFFELDFFHNLSRSPFLIVNEDQGNFLTETHQRMENEYDSGKHGWMTVLRSYLRIILIYIQRILDQEDDRRVIMKRTRLVRNFNKLVSNNFLHHRDIAFYADKLGVSVSYLNNSIKMLSGAPPGRIIRNEIVLEAKRLLAHSNLNVAEISFHLKFEDPSYFGRFFKREVQMTPQDFRLHIHEKYHYYPE